MTRNCMRMFALTLVSLSPLMVTSNPVLAQSAEAKAEPVLVDLKFPGGTIKDYLAAVRHKVGDKVNIVVTDDRAGEPRLPAMELSKVDMEAAVLLLRALYTLEDGTTIGVQVQGIENEASGGRPLYRIYSTYEGRRDAPQVKVWSLSELIGDRIKAEDALTAIELAVGIADSGHRTADVRFHEATSLLVAHGSIDQLEAIESVIDQLMEGQEQIRQHEFAVKGIEDFVAWIEQMRQLDAQQQAGAAQGQAGSAPTTDLRGAYGGSEKKDASLMSEIERLSRLIEEQSRQIKALEQKLSESRKQ